MAKKFKFRGLPKPSYVKDLGPVLAFRFHGKNGQVTELRAPDQVQGFKPNDVLDIPEDERILRHLQHHPNFELQP